MGLCILSQYWAVIGDITNEESQNGFNGYHMITEGERNESFLIQSECHCPFILKQFDGSDAAVFKDSTK